MFFRGNQASLTGCTKAGGPLDGPVTSILSPTSVWPASSRHPECPSFVTSHVRLTDCLHVYRAVRFSSMEQLRDSRLPAPARKTGLETLHHPCRCGFTLELGVFLIVSHHSDRFTCDFVSHQYRFDSQVNHATSWSRASTSI